LGAVISNAAPPRQIKSPQGLKLRGLKFSSSHTT
jgi:hypothetical protein